MRSALYVALPIAALLGAAGYNATETHRYYTVELTFSGYPAVVEHSTGALGLETFEPKIIGYFGGGKPRAVGFDCKGSDLPMIAMEEDLLPECSAVEGIRY